MSRVTSHNVYPHNTELRVPKQIVYDPRMPIIPYQNTSELRLFVQQNTRYDPKHTRDSEFWLFSVAPSNPTMGSCGDM